MRVLNQNIIFFLGSICIILLLQGPADVDAVIGKNGEPIYATLQLKPGPPHKPKPGTFYAPLKGIQRPPRPSTLLKPAPPDPRRDLKPGVRKPLVPPHNRPLPPTRGVSLGKPSGK
uniref:Uncharacterized protein n=1 Tax=Rhipicephalus zambeziensis TaxID=60191 RepID=A0A224YHY3_9ACAR